MITYLKESLSEFHNITWPTRKQTIRLTILVIGFVAVASIVIFSFDVLLEQLALIK